jgi:predicted SAM-dependent methyltransferase
MIKLNIGCGLSSCDGWINYDGSLKVKLQRLKIIGPFFNLIKPKFPKNVYYADVTTKIPRQSNSVDIIYTSHMLEHLSLEEFVLALNEIYRLLKPGAVFRSVMPDLEHSIKAYLANTNSEASSDFLREIDLGIEVKPKGIISNISSLFSNSKHLWIWDYKSLYDQLEKAGFTNIKRAFFNDSAIEDFKEIEDNNRWINCLGFECQKPT